MVELVGVQVRVLVVELVVEVEPEEQVLMEQMVVVEMAEMERLTLSQGVQ